ncbi:MAG: hypothetical protein ACFCUR_01855 [Rhodomicrobiaceae bacterium]
MRLKTLVTGVFLVILAASASAPQAQGRGGNDRDGKWERLGCEDVGRRRDRDEIKVGRREGRFSAIRLEAEGNDISILDLKVVYANGSPDDIRVRSELREGEQTRPLDLKGRDRAIDRIEIVSKRDFKGKGRGKARVCVSGRVAGSRSAEGRGRGGDWQDLGCKSVGFLGDRDVIRVGRREGRFKAIKLSVSGNTVYMNDLKVFYTRGAPDDIRVRSEIKEGRETRPLDLKGRERSIDRIEMIYRAKPSFKGKARVCVLGLQ